MTLFCNRCRQSKTATREQFVVRYGELIRVCRTCARSADRVRYAANREPILAQKKTFRDQNPETIILNRRRTYLNNKEAISARAANRYRADPLHRLRCATRTRFVKIFKAKGLKKITAWQSLVGYSVADLKQHIDAQLKSPMTWDNYGSVWHVDHKTPVASFDLPRQLRECWALSNLQPLLKRDNHRKGARLTEEGACYV
jgi:hypothetical protein